jgi:Uncharacterised protein family UPF0547
MLPLALIIWIGLTLASASIAIRNGRSAFGWVVLTLITGPIALIALLMMPTRSGLKTCPQCAEEVKEAANICRFCGFQFESEPEETYRGLPYSVQSDGSVASAWTGQKTKTWPSLEAFKAWADRKP